MIMSAKCWLKRRVCFMYSEFPRPALLWSKTYALWVSLTWQAGVSSSARMCTDSFALCWLSTLGVFLLWWCVGIVPCWAGLFHVWTSRLLGFYELLRIFKYFKFKNNVFACDRLKWHCNNFGKSAYTWCWPCEAETLCKIIYTIQK
jgi:hypothetical protein